MRDSRVIPLGYRVFDFFYSETLKTVLHGFLKLFYFFYVDLFNCCLVLCKFVYSHTVCGIVVSFTRGCNRGMFGIKPSTFGNLPATFSHKWRTDMFPGKTHFEFYGNVLFNLLRLIHKFEVKKKERSTWKSRHFLLTLTFELILALAGDIPTLNKVMWRRAINMLICISICYSWLYKVI